MIRRFAAGVCAGALLVTAGCSSHSESARSQGGPHQLIGLFRLDPGAVSGATVSGSWFRMVQPGGTPDAGPFMPNGDSPAEGGTVTLLQPGTAGGLRAGGYQSEPNPGFDQGNSLSGSIMKPTRFFAIDFGTSTNPVDPQTKRSVAVPSVTERDGKLTADVSAWAASWNNQEFNQGAPKPSAKQGPEVAGVAQAQQVWDWVARKWLDLPKSVEVSGPPAMGSYDAATRRYTLQWTSLIVGGPFNGFTGVWHLAGVFEPGQVPPPPVPPSH